MTCKARAVGLYFNFNDTNVEFDSIVMLGVFQSTAIPVAPGVLERNLTIRVSEMTNNSRIVCVSYNITSDLTIAISNSEEAVLQVQGII